jgi:putative transposase
VLSEHDVPIAPSTYWAHRARPVSDAVWADAHAANALVDAWRANRSVYGTLKLWAEMRHRGHGLGRDQVTRLMAIAGIVGIRRGAHHTRTTETDRTAARHPDLIGRAWNTPTHPDEWWVADFTYVWTLAGFVYVSFVTDVYSRRILGWRVTTSKTTPLVASAVTQALFCRRRADSRFTTTGLVHHSDAGSQYTSIAFTQALIDAGIAGSIGSVGDALDNALMESTIGLYKTELINRHPTTWSGRSEVKVETASWVQWFNTTRLHSSIGNLPPIEYEARYRERITAAPTGEVA